MIKYLDKIGDRFWLKRTKKKVFKYLAKDCPFYQMRVHLLRKCNYYIGGDVFIADRRLEVRGRACGCWRLRVGGRAFGC